MSWIGRHAQQCPVCGELFVSWRRGAVFCSGACRNLWPHTDAQQRRLMIEEYARGRWREAERRAERQRRGRARVGGVQLGHPADPP